MKALSGARRRRRVRRIAGMLAITALIAAAAVMLAQFDRTVETRQTEAVRRSVEAAAVECYALEGSYPSDLKYLEQNYGLVLDTRHYVYRYRVFATNLPPDIFVFRKE